MTRPFQSSVPPAFLLALLFVAALPATAQVSAEKQAQIDALREQVEELEINQMLLQTEIRDVGSADTAGKGISNAQWRKDHAEQQSRELQHVVDAYVRNAEELEQLHQEAENRPIFTLSDAAEETAEQRGEKVAKAALEAGGRRVAARTLGIASVIGDFVEYGGKWILRDINEDEIGEMVLAERKHLVEVLQWKVALAEASSEEAVRIRRLQELQQRVHENFAELALIRQRLDELTGTARRPTGFDSTTGAATPEDEKRKPQGRGVTLCDPRQAHRPVGVRQSRKNVDARDKTPAHKTPADKTPASKSPEDKTTMLLADDEACVDITGFWTLTQTTQLYDRKVSTPPLRAEIALSESGEGDVPAYDIFPASKATAPTGPIMRCSLEGYSLSCQRRVQPQACPPAKYVWEALEMEVATDVSSISGEFAQTLTMDMMSDPSGCTLTRFEGQGKMGYRLEPVAE